MWDTEQRAWKGRNTSVLFSYYFAVAECLANDGTQSCEADAINWVSMIYMSAKELFKYIFTVSSKNKREVKTSWSNYVIWKENIAGIFKTYMEREEQIEHTPYLKT